MEVNWLKPGCPTPGDGRCRMHQWRDALREPLGRDSNTLKPRCSIDNANGNWSARCSGGFECRSAHVLINPFDNSEVTNYQLISDEIELKDYLESDSNIDSNFNFFNLDHSFNNKIDEILNYHKN